MVYDTLTALVLEFVSMFGGFAFGMAVMMNRIQKRPMVTKKGTYTFTPKGVISN